MYQFYAHDRCQMCSSDLRSGSRVIGFRMGCSQGLRPLRNRALLTNVCVCGSCGLVYADPMPIPLDLQDHYSSESGQDYHGFGDWHEGWFASQIETFKKFFSRDRYEDQGRICCVRNR